MSSSGQKTSSKTSDSSSSTTTNMAVDKSSSFGIRRWSRNLSAQRHRELNRLNQIEIRRQYLELRKQNDLLDQISTTGQKDGKSSRDSPDPVSDRNSRLERENLSNQTGSQRLEVSEKDTVKIGTHDDHPIDDRDLPSSPDNSDESGQERAEPVDKRPNSPNFSIETDKVALDSNDKEDSSRIGTEELIKFVSSRVPRNKRVLCLIAIIDIDDGTCLDSLAGDTRVDNLSVIDGPKERRGLQSENSLSASSSISADMLYIGSVAGTSPNNVQTSNSISTVRQNINSFSDIEDGLGSATDEGSRCESRTSPGSELDDSMPSNKPLLRGRDSPLVHPDGETLSDSRRSSLVTHNLERVTNSKQGERGKTNSKTKFQKQVSNQSDQTIEQVHHRSHPTKSKADDECLNLFDNDSNPFSGAVGVLLAGKRRKKVKTYLIGLNEYGHTRRNNICKLKSNVFGTQFNAIIRKSNAVDNNGRCTIASIIYETNVLGFKGPRKMRVFLAKDETSLMSVVKNLPDAHKKDPSSVIQLKNMTPAWNIESQSYVLNFHGRVTQASVKNFQLIECDENLHEGQSTNKGSSQPNWQSVTNVKDGYTTTNNEDSNLRLSPSRATTASDAIKPSATGLNYSSSIVMQFGRVSNHEFTCDVTYPLSILQAFSIALSSFDSKLACE